MQSAQADRLHAVEAPEDVPVKEGVTSPTRSFRLAVVSGIIVVVLVAGGAAYLYFGTATDATITEEDK